MIAQRGAEPAVRCAHKKSPIEWPGFVFRQGEAYWAVRSCATDWFQSD